MLMLLSISYLIDQGCTKPGVYGNSCETPCPIHCKNNDCNIKNGTCYECDPGWKGTTCQISMFYVTTIVESLLSVADQCSCLSWEPLPTNLHSHESIHYYLSNINLNHNDYTTNETIATSERTKKMLATHEH